MQIGVLGCDVEGRGQRVNGVVHVAMCNHHSFRLARRARGVHHIGEIVDCYLYAFYQRRFCLAGQIHPLTLRADHLEMREGEQVTEMRLREHQRDLGIL